jgi:hypothetical protein
MTLILELARMIQPRGNAVFLSGVLLAVLAAAPCAWSSGFHYGPCDPSFVPDPAEGNYGTVLFSDGENDEGDHTPTYAGGYVHVDLTNGQVATQIDVTVRLEFWAFPVDPNTIQHWAGNSLAEATGGHRLGVLPLGELKATCSMVDMVWDSFQMTPAPPGWIYMPLVAQYNANYTAGPTSSDPGWAILSFVIIYPSLRTYPAVPPNTVVEYYNAPWDMYFMTPIADEINILDTRLPPFGDWVRTGVQFTVFPSTGAPAGTVNICRFFNESFAPKSSHFYAAKGLGCEQTIASFPDWKLETSALFNVRLPSPDGGCPTPDGHIFRYYNNGKGGAPNHRFVPEGPARNVMLSEGWTPEGNGPGGVAFCANQ